MKVILDIDSDILDKMNGYCTQKDVPLNELIEKLFMRYIQEPANIIDELYAKEGDLKKLEEFQALLHRYLNDAIGDIEALSESGEAYDTDKPMADVFRTLSRELIHSPFVMTELFKTYTKS